MQIPGNSFHGHFSSADASALSEENARFSLFAGGGVTALTLNSSDYVVITGLSVNSTAAVAVTIYDGANNAAGTGETIWKGDLAAKATVTWNMPTGHVCQKGTWPKVLAAAGQVECFIQGYIARSGT